LSETLRARLAAAQRALAAEPGAWRHRLELVAALRLLGRHAEALDAVREAADLHPAVGAVSVALGHVEAARGAAHLAEQAFARAVELDPQDQDAWLRLGTTRFRMGDIAAAEGPLRRALTLDPADARVRIALSAYCLRTRAAPEARALLAPILDDRPDAALASAWARVCLATDQPAEALPVVEAACAVDPRNAVLAFATGDVLDRLGDHAAAFAAYTRGNRLMGVGWDREAHDRSVDAVLSAFDRAAMAGAARARASGAGVVLVVGLPRSGTSLLEQALACHPAIGGGGELDLLRRLSFRLSAALGAPRRWFTRPLAVTSEVYDQLADAFHAELVRRAGPAALRIDKSPDNALHLGLAHLVLPGVRVLHVVRDPVDSGWSCYRQAFGDGLAWSRSLGDIAAYRATLDRAMAHWRTVLPEPPLEVPYAALVGRPEETLRGVLDFLGQPWDDAVLRPNESRRLVTTASHGEVQQPLHSGSIGRASPYRPWLGALAG